MQATFNAADAVDRDGTRWGLSPDEIKQRDIYWAIDAAGLAEAGQANAGEIFTSTNQSNAVENKSPRSLVAKRGRRLKS